MANDSLSYSKLQYRDEALCCNPEINIYHSPPHIALLFPMYKTVFPMTTELLQFKTLLYVYSWRPRPAAAESMGFSADIQVGKGNECKGEKRSFTQVAHRPAEDWA